MLEHIDGRSRRVLLDEVRGNSTEVLVDKRQKIQAYQRSENKSDAAWVETHSWGLG